MTGERVVGVVLEYRHHAFRPRNADHFTHQLQALRDWDVVQHADGNHGIEGLVGEGKLVAVVPVELRLGDVALSLDQHLLGDVNAMERPHTPGEVAGSRARPASHVEDVEALQRA